MGIQKQTYGDHINVNRTEEVLEDDVQQAENGTLRMTYTVSTSGDNSIIPMLICTL